MDRSSRRMQNCSLPCCFLLLKHYLEAQKWSGKARLIHKVGGTNLVLRNEIGTVEVLIIRTGLIN
jgi:hypothetical protein